MRGKGLFGFQHPGVVRITPAYAGKRSRPRRLRAPARDHPRVCGEKAATASTATRASGSPPRMRGKAAIRLKYEKADRITPAYAGKSVVRLWLLLLLWDHPRVCGEKHIGGRATSGKLGSPPRMRGKEAARDLDKARRWITPAYAGKRGTRPGKRLKRWDHPRVCGEKQITQ